MALALLEETGCVGAASVVFGMTTYAAESRQCAAAGESNDNSRAYISPARNETGWTFMSRKWAPN